MVEFFKRLRFGTLVEAIVTVVIGVMLLVNPNEASTAVVTLVGALIIAMGVWNIGVNLYEKRDNAFAVGILKIIIGIFIATHTDTMLVLLSYIFSIYIIMDGVKELEMSIRLAVKKESGWFLFVLLSVLVIVCGIWMLFTPDITISTVAIWAGISLIVDGIIGIILVWKWHVAAKRVKDAVQDIAAIDEEK